METFVDIFSYAALACLFIALLIPLVAFIISNARKAKESDEIEKLKKSGKGAAPSA